MTGSCLRPCQRCSLAQARQSFLAHSVDRGAKLGFFGRRRQRKSATEPGDAPGQPQQWWRVPQARLYSAAGPTGGRCPGSAPAVTTSDARRAASRRRASRRAARSSTAPAAGCRRAGSRPDPGAVNGRGAAFGASDLTAGAVALTPARRGPACGAPVPPAAPAPHAPWSGRSRCGPAPHEKAPRSQLTDRHKMAYINRFSDDGRLRRCCN